MSHVSKFIHESIHHSPDDEWSIQLIALDVYAFQEMRLDLSQDQVQTIENAKTNLFYCKWPDGPNMTFDTSAWPMTLMW